MEDFKRVGASPFKADGITRDVEIRFERGSRLKVYGGSPYNNFKLKFSNSAGEGWWVGLDTLELLIAELLYIRRDMQKLEDGTAIDIEVGVAPARPRSAYQRIADVQGHPENDAEELDERININVGGEEGDRRHHAPF